MRSSVDWGANTSMSDDFGIATDEIPISKFPHLQAVKEFRYFKKKCTKMEIERFKSLSPHRISYEKPSEATSRIERSKSHHDNSIFEEKWKARKASKHSHYNESKPRPSSHFEEWWNLHGKEKFGEAQWGIPVGQKFIFVFFLWFDVGVLCPKWKHWILFSVGVKYLCLESIAKCNIYQVVPCKIPTRTLAMPKLFTAIMHSESAIRNSLHLQK